MAPRDDNSGVAPCRGTVLVPLTAPLLAIALAAIDRDAGAVETVDVATFTRVVLRPWPEAVGYALLEGGYVLAAGGLFRHWPGLADAWLLVTRFARPRHLVSATRICRIALDRVAGDPAWRRIDMRVRADARWSHSFARALGFTRPPLLLEAWGPEGADYLLFTRLGAR